tara:strand:+ start:1263 stop:1610 length:348 start_codon:yes stop_codon:yes gene_type:complete
MAFTPLAAQQTDCDGWSPSDSEVSKPFWEAASVDTVSDCLMSGADLNARAENGFTPLHWAALYNENPEVIIALLDAGADGTAVNDDGETPFDAAKDNEALEGTDAYWALSDARFE